MRQIEFRAKRVLSNEWAVGHLFQTLEQSFILLSDNKNTQLCPNDEMTLRLHDKDIVVVDPDTVGQFTGYTDYLGYDIYEGDILFTVDEAGDAHYKKVEWFKGSFVLRGRMNCICFKSLYTPLRSWTIVGTIYDNPELLKLVDKEL